MTSTAAAEGRHASWLELFFDLVIVAAVAQLAHLLRGEPGLEEYKPSPRSSGSPPICRRAAGSGWWFWPASACWSASGG